MKCLFNNYDFYGLGFILSVVKQADGHCYDRERGNNIVITEVHNKLDARHTVTDISDELEQPHQTA